MRNIVYFGLSLLLLWYWAYEDHLDAYLQWQSAPTLGEFAPAEPLQTPLPADETAAWTFKGCTITPLARYQITARLLHFKSYVDEWAGNISPFDYALGWGRMSDPTIYQKLNIGQGVRWYTYSWSDEPPIPVDEIVCHSANTHLIPATDELSNRLFYFHTDDVVRLNGYLVQVDGPGISHWRSSLSRTDTGNGSCEIMWVNDAIKVGR